MAERLPWKVCVVGAGVIGLGSATHICDLNRSRAIEVTIISDKFWPDLTSNIAAGFWEPYSVGNLEQRPLIRKWSTSTWDHVLKLFRSAEGAKAGVCLASGYVLLGEPQPDYMEYWRDTFLTYRRMKENELKLFPSYRYGYGYTTLISSPARYIPWLMEKLRKKNVKFVRRKVESLDELSGDYDVIVNCTGIGAVHFGDNTVHPGRGQIIKVHAPWIHNFVIAEKGNKHHYIIPCPDFVVLGGTNQRGDWELKPRELDRKDIWEGCCEMLPQLRDAKVLEDCVGLRPLRESIRIEAEQIATKYGKKWVVHNYGHGGAGITTHWGCGEEAASLVKECLQRAPHSKL